LVEKPVAKRPLEMPWHRCEDNIKLEPGKMWLELICLRAGTVGSVMNTVMKL
jgi:hypothetical protein